MSLEITREHNLRGRSSSVIQITMAWNGILMIGLNVHRDSSVGARSGDRDGHRWADLKPTVLKMYPDFSMMTWKEWRVEHPNTPVLSKRTRRGLEGMSMGYTDYHRSSSLRDDSSSVL